MPAAPLLDLPLETMPGGRSLGWLLGALIYGGILLLSIATVSDSVLRHYRDQPVLMTLALPPAPATPENLEQTDKILDLLSDLDGVVFVEALQPDAAEKFLGLWAGETEMALAVPRLIDVGLRAGAALDLETIEDELSELTPGIAMGETVEPGATVLPLADAARRLGGSLGLGCVFLALMATGLSTSLNVRRQVAAVGLLRQMGATDRYIARQFEHFALLQGIKGAALGFALAAATVMIGLDIFKRTAATEAANFGLEPLDWVLIAFVPAIIALLIIPIARLAAHWRLRSLEA